MRLATTTGRDACRAGLATSGMSLSDTTGSSFLGVLYALHKGNSLKPFLQSGLADSQTLPLCNTPLFTAPACPSCLSTQSTPLSYGLPSFSTVLPHFIKSSSWRPSPCCCHVFSWDWAPPNIQPQRQPRHQMSPFRLPHLRRQQLHPLELRVMQPARPPQPTRAMRPPTYPLVFRRLSSATPGS